MHKQIFLLSILCNVTLILLLFYSFGTSSKPSISIDFHQKDRPKKYFPKARLPLNKDKSYIFSRLEYYNQTRKHSENVIAFLVASATGDARVAFNPYPILRRRINQLDQRLDDHSATDLIIFHTGYPFRSDLLPIIESTTRSVEFVNVDHIFYKFSPGFQPHITDPFWSQRGKWNYQHMCYFWFKQVFELPIMQRYRYMMRLDDDSQILGRWPNVFDLMIEHQALYLANVKAFDYENVLPGITQVRNLTADYIIKHKLIVRNHDMIVDMFDDPFTIPCFYNNLEVLDLSFIRRKEVVDFIQAVDESMGIFLYRWGDSTLRYIILAIFANETQVLYREDLKLAYCHKC